MDADLWGLEMGLPAVAEYDHGLCAKEEVRLEDLADSLDPVAKELELLNTEHKTHLTATKGRFNVFTVLRSAGDEVGLHTRWLAFLLDPNGTHDCDDTFLKLFLKTLAEGVQPHDDSQGVYLPHGLETASSTSAKMISEEREAEGQPDIQIDLPLWGGIIVENKIYAGDQRDQLEHYGKILDRKYGKSGKHPLLLYLTRDGAKSESANRREYYRISYRKHILKWLEECLRETYQYVNINQAIQQYRNVVCEITGELPLENEYRKKIVKIIEKHPAIIKHYVKLYPAIKELRRINYVTFWEGVNKHLSRDNIRVGEIRTGTDCGGYDYWRISVINEQGQPETGLLTIFFEHEMYFYICAWPKAEVDKLDRDFTKNM